MISTAVQNGNCVYVYSMTNTLLCALSGTLTGFTSNTVSVKQGDIVFVYDASGRVITTHYTN